MLKNIQAGNIQEEMDELLALAMIDFFAAIPREDLEQNIGIGLSREQDWTFTCPSAAPAMIMKWFSLFGRYDGQVSKVFKCPNIALLTKLTAYHFNWIFALRRYKQYFKQ